MLGTILKWLTGGGISAIGDQINRWQEIRAKAENDRDRLQADTMIAQLEATKQSVLQAQKDPVERWVRVGFALPFVLYNAKLVVWDKVLSMGATDGLSPELLQLQTVVISGYFLHSIIRGK